MSDLVERLRKTREWTAFPAVPICVEAADEIEQMRGLLDKWHTKAADLATENERLRGDLAALNLCEPGFLDRVLRERDAMRAALDQVKAWRDGLRGDGLIVEFPEAAITAALNDEPSARRNG